MPVCLSVCTWKNPAKSQIEHKRSSHQFLSQVMVAILLSHDHRVLFIFLSYSPHDHDPGWCALNISSLLDITGRHCPLPTDGTGSSEVILSIGLLTLVVSDSIMLWYLLKSRTFFWLKSALESSVSAGECLPMVMSLTSEDNHSLSEVI